MGGHPTRRRNEVDFTVKRSKEEPTSLSWFAGTPPRRLFSLQRRPKAEGVKSDTATGSSSASSRIIQSLCPLFPREIDTPSRTRRRPQKTCFFLASLLLTAAVVAAKTRARPPPFGQMKRPNPGRVHLVEGSRSNMAPNLVCVQLLVPSKSNLPSRAFITT